MEIFLEIVNTYGPELLGIIMKAVAALLGILAAVLFTRFANTETKKKVAKTCVLFVEQAFKDLHGDEKMAAAMERAAALLKKYGIKFDAGEMLVLAEAALAELNGAFTKRVQILEGMDVEELTDEQLRGLLKFMGFTYTENMNREEMLAALDEAPAAEVHAWK